MRGADGDVAKVDNADLALAEIAEVLRVLQLQAVGLGHRLFGRIRGKLAETETAAACGMHHLVIDGLDLGHRNVPARSGGGFEHDPRRCSDLAHRDQIVPGAARAVGVLVAVFDLIAMGLLHLDPRPVGLHLLSHNQGQAGADTRAHLGTVRHDGHGSIGSNRDEDPRVDYGAVRHVAGAGLVGERLAGHHGRGQYKTSGYAEALEDGATRHFLDLDAGFHAAKPGGIGPDVHDHTPVDARWMAFSMRW